MRLSFGLDFTGRKIRSPSCGIITNCKLLGSTGRYVLHLIWIQVDSLFAPDGNRLEHTQSARKPVALRVLCGSWRVLAIPFSAPRASPSASSFS